MSSKDPSEDLLVAIEETDPNFKKKIEEEKKLITEVVSDEKNNSENINTNEKLEELNVEIAETIERAIKTDNKVQEKLQNYVDKKLQNYGSIESVLEKIKNPDLTKTPRYVQKMMRKHLPDVINYLEKNTDKKELTDMLKILLEKIKDNLVRTKPKSMLEKIKTKYDEYKLTKRFWGGRSKRQRLNKTKKHIKGGNEEGILYLIAWVSFLIACCCTGIGCFICGPLLVATVCIGMAANGANICGSFVGVPSKENPDNKKGGKQKNKRSKRMKKTKRNNK